MVLVCLSGMASNKAIYCARHANKMESLDPQEIRSRGLDQYYNVEEDLLVGKADLAAVEKLLKVFLYIYIYIYIFSYYFFY